MAELQHVAGLKELQQALKQLPERIAKNVLRGSVNAGAAVIRKEVQQRAPVYTGDVSQGAYLAACTCSSRATASLRSSITRPRRCRPAGQLWRPCGQQRRAA